MLMTSTQMTKRAGDTGVEVPRSLAAQIDKHAQVNNALALGDASGQARAEAESTLKAATAEIVGNTPPGVLASDSMTSEEPMLQVISDRVWSRLSCNRKYVCLYMYGAACHINSQITYQALDMCS